MFSHEDSEISIEILEFCEIHMGRVKNSTTIVLKIKVYVKSRVFLTDYVNYIK